ncbi:MAG: hypothetical protein EBU46_00865 [Nitrosomonadaceae bacterium]|nr:hypothetical protein [Nitrosomonadaceae bacterium]
MNKQAFEQGFIKAAMAEGLNQYEAIVLYKIANSQPTSYDFLKATLQLPGSTDALKHNALIGGGLGALGGGLVGALSADETKGQSKWQRGFGGALAGGGLGALAGSGMNAASQFDKTKELANQMQIHAGRNILQELQNSNAPVNNIAGIQHLRTPEQQSMLLQRLRDNRTANETLRGFNFTDALSRPTQLIKDFHNGELTNSQTIRR